MNSEEIWQRCLEYIRDKVSESVFELWFKPVRFVALKETEAIIIIPNRFFREWIEDNYPYLISDAIESVAGRRVELAFKIDTEYGSDLVKRDKLLKTRKERLATKGIYLNPKYTFDSFVSGPSNEFARAASLAVSESLGKTYNPLFLYGDVGLGKTHLVNAIGNRVVDIMNNVSLLYVSAEQFTNEVVSAIRHEKMAELKEKYRNLDILLMDDIQFIANKTQTQEEFFHTFNSLYEKQKQIVISSDRPPKELSAITDRLKSRFTMGLIADIQPPSVELKMAILQRKAENQKIILPDDTSYYLATKIRTNIRELEGCLIKLAAYSNLTGGPINIIMAKNILKDMFHDDSKPVNVDNIQKVAADYFGVKLPDMKAKKRTKEIIIPRQVAMYISKRLTELSLGDIGKAFGGKDHATVIYACRQIENKMENDESFSKMIEQIINRIKP